MKQEAEIQRDMLREEIAKLIYAHELKLFNSDEGPSALDLADDILALIPSSSSKQPSGLESVKKCEDCEGGGSVVTLLL